VKTLAKSRISCYGRKLTLRTRPVLRSGANEWDLREICFNKTLWKANDDF